MSKKIHSFIISAGIILFPFVVVGAKPRTITLDECVNIALQNNPDILEIGEIEKKSLADYQVSRAQRGLRVDGEFKTIERMRSDSPSDPNVRIPGKDTDLGLFAGLYSYYYLFDTKKKKAEEASKINIALTRIESEKIKEDVIHEVKKAYYECLMAKDILSIREKLLENAQERQKLVKIMHNAGLQPATDLTQANVSYSQAMLDFEKSKNISKTYLTSLYIAMGLRDMPDIALTDIEKENLPAIKYSSEELGKLALIYNYELRLINEKKKISKLNIQIAQSVRKPSVLISMGLGMENKALYLFNDDRGAFGDNFATRNWEPVFTATVTMAVPIYYGGAIIANINSAVIDYNRLMYQERSTQIKIKNNIERQYESIDEIKKQIQITKMIIENSERHALLARRNYENGATSLMDLQIAEAGVINARIEYLNCIYQYYIALAAISYTLGLSEDSICLK
ncbi:MAG: TolC family protein [Leptospirales bacterium]|nr:TolC family protein [Leptospirales bacterium]